MSTSEPTRARAATEEKSGARRDRERPPAPEPLPLPVVDNHCHLDIADGEWLDTRGAIDLAGSVNVTRIVQIGCDLPGARWAVAAAAEHPELIAGVALHPNEAPRVDDLDAAMAEIEALAGAHDKVRAVGETGLDHFRTGRGRAGGPAGELPPAHRPRQAARQDAGHPRPGRPRRGAADPRRGGRARALGDALLLRRRRLRPRLPGPGRAPELRRHGHLQERRQPAQRAGRDADRPDPGRDRRAVPHAQSRSAGDPTRPTSSRTPCARWRRSAGTTSRRSARPSTTTPRTPSAGPGDGRETGTVTATRDPGHIGHQLCRSTLYAPPMPVIVS